MMQNVLAPRSVAARRHPSVRDRILRLRRDPQRARPEAAVTHPQRRPLAKSTLLSPNTIAAAPTRGQGFDSASRGGSKSP